MKEIQFFVSEQIHLPVREILGAGFYIKMTNPSPNKIANSPDKIAKQEEMEVNRVGEETNVAFEKKKKADYEVILKAKEVKKKEEEEKVRRKELKVKKLVKEEEAETPIEVIASLWVGGIATLTLLSLVVLQVSFFRLQI